MNDGVDPWIGVDLDGTLAMVGGHIDMRYMIGVPVPRMVQRVQYLLRHGYEVRVFTARMSENPELWQKRIGDWTEHYIGTRLVATNVKDFGCIAIYDDIAIAVEQNEGTIWGWEDSILTTSDDRMN